MPGGVIENATACYEPERGIVRLGVNRIGRVLGFEVLADGGDPENRGAPVGERHVDGVSRAERAEPEEDRGALITVDVALDNRRADLAGGHRVFKPGGLARARDQ